MSKNLLSISFPEGHGIKNVTCSDDLQFCSVVWHLHYSERIQAPSPDCSTWHAMYDHFFLRVTFKHLGHVISLGMVAGTVAHTDWHIMCARDNHTHFWGRSNLTDRAKKSRALQAAEVTRVGLWRALCFRRDHPVIWGRRFMNCLTLKRNACRRKFFYHFLCRPWSLWITITHLHCHSLS